MELIKAEMGNFAKPRCCTKQSVISIGVYCFVPIALCQIACVANKRQGREVKKATKGFLVKINLHFYHPLSLSVTPPPPERRTPVKHPLPHVIARFSPGGQLIKVLPNVPADGMPALVEVHNLEVSYCSFLLQHKHIVGRCLCFQVMYFLMFNVLTL